MFLKQSYCQGQRVILYIFFFLRFCNANNSDNIKHIFFYISSITYFRLKEIRERKTGTRGDVSTKSVSNFGNERIFSLSEEDIGDKLSRIVPELGENLTLPKAILFPGLEGFARVLKSLAEKLADARTVQYLPDGQNTSVATIVLSLVPVRTRIFFL